MNRQILQGDAQNKLKELKENSIDLITTDPPYGYGFMNKDWDKAIIGVDTWRECLRVLKPGAFALIMSAPRQDVLAHMIVNLTDAGFVTNFTSIYWAYASGFPKAANISKLIDKRNGRESQEYKKLGNYIKKQKTKLGISTKTLSALFPSKTGGITGCVWNWENGQNVPTISQWNILKKKLHLDNSFDKLIEREEAQREIVGKRNDGRYAYNFSDKATYKSFANKIGGNAGYDPSKVGEITKPSTEQAKKLDGSYAGFQPKPSVEVILVVMKPLSEKNYVEQAMLNGKGITWLDDAMIPFVDDKDVESSKYGSVTPSNVYGWANTEKKNLNDKNIISNTQGRFPANLLVSDDALNDGKITKSNPGLRNNHNIRNVYGIFPKKHYPLYFNIQDSGSFSRYFDLDAWQAQFLIVEKASKSEKNAGLDNVTEQTITDGRTKDHNTPSHRGTTKRKNNHPTVKPISLMSYLITMGSREGDTILDPFAGSGTTLIAASLLKRNSIGIELDPHYYSMIKMRLEYWKNKSFEKIQKIKKQAEKNKIQSLETFL